MAVHAASTASGLADIERNHGSFLRVLSTATLWVLSAAAAYFFWFFLNHGVHGLDSHAYWLTGRHSSRYRAEPGSLDAYLYSPAFAQLIKPATLLSWPAFRVLWMVLEAVAFAWLLAPLGWRLGVPAIMWCTIEISVGNVYSFLAVAAVLGMRRPACWAVPLFTKVSLCLGPIWFAARRDWRNLGASLVASALVLTVSVAMSPALWSDWFHFLVTQSAHGQALLPARVGAAVVLTVYAARKDRALLLVLAVLLANPMVQHSLMALTLLAAVPRMRARDRAVACARQPGTPSDSVTTTARQRHSREKSAR